MIEDKTAKRDVVTARIGASIERQITVEFLKSEAALARHAQDNAEITSPDKLYRMGQKDGLLLAAEAIERGHHVASAPTPNVSGLSHTGSDHG